MPLSSASSISSGGVPIAGDMMTPSPPSCSSVSMKVPLLFDGIVVVGENEGVPAAVEFALDRLEDFAVERVHDVVHDDADDAGPRRPEAGGAAIVDIAERARLILDLVAGHGGDQRTVAQGKGNGRRGNAKRFRNGRKLDLLRHVPLPA